MAHEDFEQWKSKKEEWCFWPWRSVGYRLDMGAVLISLFILAWGVTWLGNEVGWWKVIFPFWPLVLIMLALAMLFSAAKKMMH